MKKAPNLALTVTVALLLSAAPSLRANLLLNGTFDSGFTGFSSSYTFVPSGSSPGLFGIRTFSLDFNSGYDAFVDHTSGTGNMMLIDGVPSITAWEETVSVAPNTDYAFSAWATTADGANLPTLRFFINSAQVGSDFDLLIPAGTWQNFTNTWNSGSSTTATIAVVDTASTSFGNDFALDDMSFAQVVPEPSTSFLFGIAAVAATGILRRRKSA